MLSNEEAHYLLNLEKVLEKPDALIDLGNKKNRLDLISYEDTDRKFWVEITSNTKIILKTSIHHVETGSFIGLLRVDFRGRHTNPEEVSDAVPKKLLKYKGKRFGIDEPHVHVHVEGYKQLVWAIPIEDTDFEVKQINDRGDLFDLIRNFAKAINLTSELNIQQGIL